MEMSSKRTFGRAQFRKALAAILDQKKFELNKKNNNKRQLILIIDNDY
jgi:hypothetical protein